MIRFVLAAVVAALFVLPASAQRPPLNQVVYVQGQYYHQGKIVYAGLFNQRELQQIQSLTTQMIAQNAAAMQSLQAAHQTHMQLMAAQSAASQASADRQYQMMMALLMQQNQQKAVPVPPPPINIYLPQQTIPIAPPQQQLPILPPQQIIPIAPPQQILPILPPQQILPIIPPQQILPVLPPQQIIPIAPPANPIPLTPPGPVPPPVGFQRLTTQRDLPPVITLTVTRADGSTYVVPWNPPQEKLK